MRRPLVNRLARRSPALLVASALVAAVTVSAPTATAAEPGRARAESASAADGFDAPGTLSYLVNAKGGPLGTSAAVRAVTAEGGTVIAGYPQIGVVVAHAGRADFAERVRGRSGVASAGATRTVPIGGGPATAAVREADADERIGTAPIAPKAGAARSAKGEEPLSGEQWNLRRIGADKAHGVTVGSPGVRVGVIDTGVDDTHEDLTANFDAANSVNCVGGKPDRTAGAWRPDPSTAGWYHGTHVAGIVAAAKNGKGVAGVAPGGRIAAVKVAEGNGGYFYPESVLCGFMWAAAAPPSARPGHWRSPGRRHPASWPTRILQTGRKHAGQAHVPPLPVPARRKPLHVRAADIRRLQVRDLGRAAIRRAHRVRQHRGRVDEP